jgi:hypothetical protein
MTGLRNTGSAGKTTFAILSQRSKIEDSSGYKALQRHYPNNRYFVSAVGYLPISAPAPKLDSPTGGLAARLGAPMA